MYRNINHFSVLISPFFTISLTYFLSSLLQISQNLVDQVALMLHTLPDEHSAIKVHLPAARVCISGEPMTLRGHGDAGKCPDEDNKSSVAFLRESCRRVVTVAVGYAARPIESVVQEYEIFTSLWEPFQDIFKLVEGSRGLNKCMHVWK